jgi:arginine/serine-rich splicing factor 7
MARVYVGNLDPAVTAREIEDEFRVFGVLRRLVIHLCSGFSGTVPASL